MKNSYTAELFIMFIFLCLLSSCANLPGKEKSGKKPDVPEIVSQRPDDPENQPGLVVRQQDAWTAPAEGEATVTPIVLFIEQRGEDASMIIRTDPETITDSFVYDSGGNISGVVIPTPNAVSPGGMRDDMKVYSFSPINGAVVLPNQFMHLDIMLQNTGTTTWQTSYQVVDISGSPMTVQREYYLPYAVAPNGTVLLSIFMTAPEQLGSYTASFQIRDASGVAFGNIDYTLTVGAFSSITEIPTLTATVTHQFCVEYSDRPEFRYCFYDGERYLTPVPEINQEEE